MRRFSPAEVERIRDLVARGYSCVGIAGELGRDALAIRHKVCALGLRTRPHKMKDVHDVRIGSDVLALLKGAAKLRGVTTQRLAGQILSAVAVDGIVDAVIDDDAKRQRKLERARIYRENYRRRRRNGDPVLGPREAGLLGFRTALTNEGMTPQPRSLPYNLKIVMSPRTERPRLYADVQVPQLCAGIVLAD